MVFVFDFGFRERGAVIDAPVDGLAAAIDITLFHEIQERAGNGGFVFVAHRQIGIVPAAENAEALEIFFVLFDVTERELTAQLAELRRRNFPFSAQLFFHLGLNRQAVAIPAGDVGRIVPRHAFGLNDKILENFVEAGAEMDLSGGVRRAGVQNKERLAFARFQDTFVDVSVVPGFELPGLILRQAGFHREVRFRQVQRFLEFEWLGHN